MNYEELCNEYVYNAKNNLDVPEMGGTDLRFANDIMPTFHEILVETSAKSILEIGFNVGGSALMFLTLHPYLHYHSVDIIAKKKSAAFLASEFPGFRFVQGNSMYIQPGEGFTKMYDMVFIDGDHSRTGVIADVLTAKRFKPEFILFDDVRHPSHSYIEEIITVDFKDYLEIVKLYEFNELWKGYSMALCKTKN